MKFWMDAGVVLASYLIGAIPFGLLVVKIISGKDVRQIESGRTGGTNAMRAAGVWAGLVTVILDTLKGAAAVVLAQIVEPASIWLRVVAPLMAILGHNFSIFLIERNGDGRLHLRGGAGGATCAGGILALWPPAFAAVILLGAGIYWWVGYASVTTMSTALIAIVIFGVRAGLGYSPWSYVVYGVIAEALLIWALIPNLRRLREGNERLVGLRAKQKKAA
jgi:glycerol-3-phosphate acyltransferase PlsY